MNDTQQMNGGVKATVNWIQKADIGTMLFLLAPTYAANPFPCVLDEVAGPGDSDISLRVVAVIPSGFRPGTQFSLSNMQLVVIAEGEVT